MAWRASNAGTKNITKGPWRLSARRPSSAPSLILALVFLPVLALGGIWNACALTLGLLTGYLLYAITRHATHHWLAESAWLNQRKCWHALHHHDASRLGAA